MDLAPVSTAQAEFSAVGLQQPPEPGGLKLLVKGFSPSELKLLQGVVFLSKRRAPRIDLVDEDALDEADVVMVDAHDPEAQAWVHRQHGLSRKAVIWVDGQQAHAGHTLAKRPIQWPVLPVLLYNALDQGPQKRNSPASTNTKTRRILVIDDSLPARTHIKSLLQPRGCTVVEADSAEAGLRADAAANYDCVLMDVMLPGMDGYEACRRVKAQHASGQGPAVVMLTSKSSPFDRIRGKMAGCDDYLTKPVEPAHLFEVIARYIETEPRPSAMLGVMPPPYPA